LVKGKGVAAARFLLLGWRNDHGKPEKQEIETALDDFSGEKRIEGCCSASLVEGKKKPSKRERGLGLRLLVRVDW
jgi:hypothetical protein